MDVRSSCCVVLLFFFKQKTAYEMRISDWSSDVCSSDLVDLADARLDGIAAVGIGEDVVQTRSLRDHGRRAAGEDTGKKRRNWRHALDRQHDDQQRRDQQPRGDQEVGL